MRVRQQAISIGATLNYGAAALAEVLGLEAVGNPFPTSAEPVPSCSLLRRSANALPNVRCRENRRKHLLAVSISPFDPQATFWPKKHLVIIELPEG